MQDEQLELRARDTENWTRRLRVAAGAITTAAGALQDVRPLPHHERDGGGLADRYAAPTAELDSFLSVGAGGASARVA